MTRIVAGTLGGRRLSVPPAGTRPTSERAREALFSSLAAHIGSVGDDALHGLRFLDLYAGSGAVGLEAASRGASHVVLVESAARALTVLRANLALTAGAVAGNVQLLAASAEQAVRELSPPAFDVVFADPPYDVAGGTVAAVLTGLVERGLLADDGVVVIERSSRQAWSWPAGLQPLRHRKYGEATFWYGRAASVTSA